MSNMGYLEQYNKNTKIKHGSKLSLFFRHLIDKKAQKINQKNRFSFFMLRVLELFKLSPDQKLTVLEVGAGDGWAMTFAADNISYIAVDRASFYKEALEKRGIQFLEVDMESTRLPLESESVDIVILNHLIEHINDTDFFMDTIIKVLKPGACLYVRTPNIKKVGASFWDDYTHVKPFTFTSLKHLMATYQLEEKFSFHSNSSRMNIDTLTNGLFRKYLFNRIFGGKEIEAGYILNK